MICCNATDMVPLTAGDDAVTGWVQVRHERQLKDLSHPKNTDLMSSGKYGAHNQAALVLFLSSTLSACFPLLTSTKRLCPTRRWYFSVSPPYLRGGGIR